MPVKKKARKKKAAKKKAVKRSRRVVRKKVTRKKVSRRKVSTVRVVKLPEMKKRWKKTFEEGLKEQLFKRDKATSYKQHRAANLKIDALRKKLRAIDKM